jgi:hypothetical protein
MEPSVSTAKVAGVSLPGLNINQPLQDAEPVKPSEGKTDEHWPDVLMLALITAYSMVA